MGNQIIYIYLKNLIYKKGLFYYLESWGFSPQSISKEGLTAASLSQNGQRNLLICEEGFFSSGVRIKNSYYTLIFVSKKSNLSKFDILGHDIGGFFDQGISPVDLQQAIRQVQQGEKYIQPGLFLERDKISKSLLPTELSTLSELTSREKEVLKHIADELTNKEIAKLLFISPRTVETHRRNLIQKMKVKNSVGLVKAYLEARSIA